MYDNPILGRNSKVNWPQSEIDQWGKWDYGNGFDIKGKSSKLWRRKMSGMPYGLSVLVDPNIGKNITFKLEIVDKAQIKQCHIFLVRRILLSWCGFIRNKIYFAYTPGDAPRDGICVGR